MKKPVPPLSVIDAETLSDKPLATLENVVADLLPPGLTILGGAPKVGKSWLMLDLCNHVANGEPFWGNEVRQGSTLYLCLEDTPRRLQNRINTITDSPSPASFLATEALSLAGGLCEQIRAFAASYPDLVLVVIDTLQLVRGSSTELSYAGDYGDVRQLKTLADELSISIVVIHHLRKMDDSDPLNKISGTTGLNGAADATLVLERSGRDSGEATLLCTGRDIEYRELSIRLNGDCVWELVADSREDRSLLLPHELQLMVAFVQDLGEYHGSNTEFAERFCLVSGVELTAKALKQQMNLHRSQLERERVHFQSRRSNGQRLLDIWFKSDASDSSDAAPGLCVPCDPVEDGVVVQAG